MGHGLNVAADQLCDLRQQLSISWSQSPHLPEEAVGLADLVGPLDLEFHVLCFPGCYCYCLNDLLFFG